MAFDPESLGFTPGTLIQTLDDGHLPIEQIRVGMLVLAQPEAGGEGLTGRCSTPWPTWTRKCMPCR